MQTGRSYDQTSLITGKCWRDRSWTASAGREAWAEARPYRYALRVLYNEGRNLRSVEGDVRWTFPSGQPTDRARATLARLTRRVVGSLVGLRSL